MKSWNPIGEKVIKSMSKLGKDMGNATKKVATYKTRTKKDDIKLK